MTTLLAIVSLAFAVGWVPLALRFSRGWKTRKNPVSLAICLATLLFAYTNVLFALVLMGQTTWLYFAVATHTFDLIVLVNFYISFHWSDKRFANQRREYSVPPTNTTNTPRAS